MPDFKLSHRSLVPFAVIVFAPLAGCILVEDSDGLDDGNMGPGGTGGVPNPVGSVARTADEAWPTRPDVAPITNQEIADACVARLACADLGSGQVGVAVDLCVGQTLWAAERAVPLSNLGSSNERAEFAVRCVLDAAGDCDVIAACISGRNPAIQCEEDGCRISGGRSFSVSCAGSIATLRDGSSTIERDCARAFADCDPASPTGCTDRQFTACPSDGDRRDRCDGNIRLGCDSAGQVSYRDCERMSGTCGATADGFDCVYTTPADAECGSNRLVAVCEGTHMAVCVNGERIEVSAPTLCAS
jgi:hypothetical protein